MKKSLLLILIIHLSLQKASADTVDFFHVFYNDKLILESGVLGESTITLSLQELKDTDTLKFNYFNDSGKYDLEFGCVLKSGNSALFRASQQPNSGDYAIPISVIKQSFLNMGNKEFEIWYYDKLCIKINLNA